MVAPNPVMVGISALTSIGAGMAAKRAAKKQAAQARAIGQYNASIIKRNLEEELTVFRATGSQLTKSQREFKAQQKMNVAGRGGVMGGGDLSSFLESVKMMYLDQMELKRAEANARITANNEAERAIWMGKMGAQQAMAQGNAALAQGVLGAMGTIAEGYAYGAFGGGGTKPPSIGKSVNPFTTVDRQAVNQLQTRPTSFPPSAFSMQTPDFNTGFIAPRSMVPSNLQLGGR